MKTEPKLKPLTFGALISSIYNACGRQSAVGIVRLALDARLVSFPGPHRILVEGPKA